MSYIGRFAPSPSGPLHFGSLVAALGSYFQAKSQNGTWLVRMEDLDPPREMSGAAKLILETLESYHLYWDGCVMYQSQRHHAYQEKIDEWLENNKAYYCQCTRKQIKQNGRYYSGVCRNQSLNRSKHGSTRIHSAIRIKVEQPVFQFQDVKHGTITIPDALAREDFIIKRSDGLFAYNLAVVLDDIEQNITQVVRGADLIEPTGRQIGLYQLLQAPPVSYLHLPVAIDSAGNKLSKQNHASAINLKHPKPTLLLAMQFLGLTLPDNIHQGTLDNILSWGCQNWSVNTLPAKLKITTPFSNERQ